MTNTEALVQIKTRLGINFKSSREAELTAILTANINVAKSICGRKTLIDNDMAFVINSVLMDYNRAGEEGMSGRSAIGINTSYQNSYDYLVKMLSRTKSNKRLTGD